MAGTRSRVDSAAYDRAGMGEEWSLHHQGGSIGYQAREQIATPNDSTPIVPGMAFAWNPSTVGFKREEFFKETLRREPLTREAAAEKLRHCREQLALHKVPRKVHWRSALPRTVSGKVKRLELAAEIAKESL